MKKFFWRQPGLISAVLIALFIMAITARLIPFQLDEGISTLSSLLHMDTYAATAYGKQLDSRMGNDRIWVNAFGYFERLIGKHEMKDFTILRDMQDSLYGAPVEKESAEEIENIAESFAEACAFAQDAGAAFLFVQCPYKSFSLKEELSDYSYDYTWQNESDLLDELAQRGIPTLDLREKAAVVQYYKTDHHWTVAASFAAAKETAAALNESMPGRISTDGVFDEERYQTLTYPSSFTGSTGIKTGVFYVGKDDFSVLVPMFATSLQLTNYYHGELTYEGSGAFEECLIDMNLLENPDYYNKYNACLHYAHCRSVITNDLAPNELKILFIAHSYGRPMAMYLSLFCSELHYLDPHFDRYTDSVTAYMQDYQPDVVIVMINEELNTAIEP